ncbi:MAG: hypothetical protein A2735_01740 [Candidatus Yanofskybacteria bacterium RIFCSPHIGHO2_01_FULL_41_21]|uniref:DUF4352 domain-containing protein n=1 Tax=Candidatus Yanofskybacteria bacterium RIFCSPHIGHO2_01_FULL_41_21 TaxID=1802660 RepID=A0A1F8EBR7_9BACT|nr:MAG: hypothetical protein A2735_01740 [Candidatus Yanofskybacteria bacterium RIFCSPHIGHO2_01_FULL_41_21]
MKKLIVTILSIVTFVGGFLIFYQSRPVEQKMPITDWESKTDNQLAVTITVTPIDISSQLKKWEFEIVMDTHSVELNQDLTKMAVLVDDQGKEYKPLSWEGTIGGHHREGLLIFNQIIPTPKSVQLKVSGIGDVIRSFDWQL